MCGLAGFLGHEPATPDARRAAIQAMTRRLQHRGPDAEGYWLNEGVALGHRRLSILDLSDAGAQPMVSGCGRFVIAYNGEIYNHLELRRALELAGVPPTWRGHSDTETILAAVGRWGIDETLRRSRGMFALAIWDNLERRLSLARDRIGEKPLYWGWAGRSIVFGSELKALREHPSFSAEVSLEATAEYLRFGYVPAPRCIHVGIYKLEAGTILEVQHEAPSYAPAVPLRPGERMGNLSIRRYWSLDDQFGKESQNLLTVESEVVQAVEDNLGQAVADQLISDVPLGAFLSGGVDSSLVVALMQEHSVRPVKTFTIGFDVPSFNEAPHAAAIAKHLQTDHTEFTVTETEARGVIPRLAEIYDEPFADSSQIPTYLVCQATRQRATVALSGDGGDELFGGYNRYFWGRRVWKYFGRIPPPVRTLLSDAAALASVETWDRLANILSSVRVAPSIVHPGDKIHKVAAGLRDVQSLDDLYLNVVSIWNPPPVVDYNGPDSRSPGSTEGSAGSVSRMMMQDMRTYLPDDILCKVDRAAMAVSLETRTPFLDPRVIGVAARIPEDLKLRGGSGKWPLREVLYRRVPASLIDRPKAGFSMPIGQWLRGPLRPWAEDLLSPAALASTPFLDGAPIRKAWCEHLSGHRNWADRLWVILMLQSWLSRPTSS